MYGQAGAIIFPRVGREDQKSPGRAGPRQGGAEKADNHFHGKVPVAKVAEICGITPRTLSCRVAPYDEVDKDGLQKKKAETGRRPDMGDDMALFPQRVTTGIRNVFLGKTR